MADILAMAKKYLGTPYLWGGNTPDDGGMDCSGFVIKALNDAGYTVGDTTAQGLRSQGKQVDKNDLQPGDLLFFGKSSSNATHVGIYAGNGQMIHSSGGSANNSLSNLGKGVEIRSVRADLIEARRMDGNTSTGTSVTQTGVKGTAKKLVSSLVQFLTVLMVAVLAVVFFMLAFDIKIK